MESVKLKQTHIELQGCLKCKNRLASNSNLNSAKAKSHTEVPICLTEYRQRGPKMLVLHWVLPFQALSLNLNLAAAIPCNLLLSLSLCFSHRFPTRRQSNTHSPQLRTPDFPWKVFACWKIINKISDACFALFFKVCDLQDKFMFAFLKGPVLEPRHTLLWIHYPSCLLPDLVPETPRKTHVVTICLILLPSK